MKKYKLDLLLMSYKGLNALIGCISFKDNFEIKVFIGTDSAVEEDYSTQIRNICEENNLKFQITNKYTPKDYDYVIACSWRWLIDVDESHLIIFHDSLLPRYRGFSPLVNMLVNGEQEIGVTVLKGVKNYDHGDIYLQKKTSIDYPIKISSAIEKVSVLYKDLVIELLSSILNDNHNPIPQDNKEASYSIWRDNLDYIIDWTLSAQEICRFIDAVGFPYSGARGVIGQDSFILIDDAEVMADEKIEIRDCGKLIFYREGCPVIICGSGLLKLVKYKYYKNGIENKTLPFRTRFLNNE